MLVLQARCREMGLPDAYWSLFEVWRNKGYPDPGSIVLCEKDNCQHRERH